MTFEGNIQKFNFDRVFVPAPRAADESAPEEFGALPRTVEELEAEIALLKIDHQAELATVRAEAFQAGLDYARKEREMAVLSAADAVHAGIEHLDARLADIEASLLRDAAGFALSAAEYIAGRAIEDKPAEAIGLAIDRVMERVETGRSIEVRVHPDLLATVETYVAPRAGECERLRLRLSVVADDAVVRGDAVVAWDKGGLLLDAAARQAAVAAELDAILVDERISPITLVHSAA